MDAGKLEIRHGAYLDLTGPPRRSGEFTFLPAEVKLAGNGFSASCKLAEHMQAIKPPAEVRAVVDPGTDAPWVRGRAQQLFDIANTEEDDRGEKSCFFASFLAVFAEEERLVGVPFWCSDYYGASHLVFSSGPDEPQAELRQRIARAFWDLLLEDPNELAEYSDTMFHSGAGVTIRFGVKHGQPFFREQR